MAILVTGWYHGSGQCNRKILQEAPWWTLWNVMPPYTFQLP